ncbi:MAG: hypothetical protein HY036_01040 [Nitrospirae bacterium]|nr:hypothetical protein [Nitrospirota bacterium]
MQCHRCKGEMVVEKFQDFNDDTGRLNFHGWRCLICGEIFDPVIYSNRRQHPPPLIGKNRKLIIASKR